MTAIPDINVLLYAVDSKSPFHQPCIGWLNSALNGDEPIGFTWQSIAGFVRIGTNPKLINRPMTVAEAFGYLEAWLACRASRVLHPGANHLATFRRLVDAVGLEAISRPTRTLRQSRWSTTAKWFRATATSGNFRG